MLQTAAMHSLVRKPMATLQVTHALADEERTQKSVETGVVLLRNLWAYDKDSLFIYLHIFKKRLYTTMS